MPWNPPAVPPSLTNLLHPSPTPTMHQWGPLVWPVPSQNLGLLGGSRRAGFGPIPQARPRGPLVHEFVHQVFSRIILLLAKWEQMM